MTRLPLSAGPAGSITVTESSAKVINEDPKRGFICLQNTSDDATQIVWLGFGTAAVVNKGVPLLAGAAPFIMLPTGIYMGDIYMISESGSPVVAYQILKTNI